MSTATRVVICGNSLYLEAIAELLRSQKNIEVTYIDWRHPDALARTIALSPNVIIVEHGKPSEGRILELLHQGYPLLWLDTKQGSVAVLSERHIPAAGIADLTLVIEQIARRQVERKETSMK